MLLGVVTGGWQMARAAALAQRHLEKHRSSAFHRAKLATARIYAEQVMPRAAAYAASLRAGGETIVGFDDESF
jgi:hypothetical protein